MTQQSQSNYGDALYYPYTTFLDQNWLKTSLLYWDSISRIMPEGELSHEHFEFAEVFEKKLVIDTSPFIYSEKAGEDFILLIDGLVGREGVTDSDAVKTAAKSLGVPVVPVPRIRTGKISPRLLSYLDERKLCKVRYGNIFMNEYLGGMYMCILAKIVSQSIGSPLITDKLKFANMGQSLSLRSIPVKEQDADADVTDILLKLGIEFPSPEQLDKIPMNEIVGFNIDHRSERAALRAAINDVIHQGEQDRVLDDPNKFYRFAKFTQDNIREAQEKYKKELLRLGIKTFGSLLVATIPFSLASLGITLAALGIPYASTSVGVIGLGWTAFQHWHTYQEGADALKEKYPWQYLLTLKSEFKHS